MDNYLYLKGLQSITTIIHTERNEQKDKMPKFDWNFSKHTVHGNNEMMKHSFMLHVHQISCVTQIKHSVF